MRRRLMSTEKESDTVQEWELIANVDVENGATQVKIAVNNYNEYIIYGNVCAQSANALNVAVNREGYDWVQHRVAAIANGVHSNASKKFYLKIRKICGFTETNVASAFEGFVASEEKTNMTDTNAQAMETVEYFHFSTANSVEFTGGNIKVFAR